MPEIIGVEKQKEETFKKKVDTVSKEIKTLLDSHNLEMTAGLQYAVQGIIPVIQFKEKE